MLEEVEAIKNLPDMVSVDGVDVFFIGSGDLSQSMGYPGQQTHPEVQALMEEGVTIVDPDNTWIEADVSVGKDTTILPFTYVAVGATIGVGCRVGPFVRIAEGETVQDGTTVTQAAPIEAEA